MGSPDGQRSFAVSQPPSAALLPEQSLPDCPPASCPARLPNRCPVHALAHAQDDGDEMEEDQMEVEEGGPERPVNATPAGSHGAGAGGATPGGPEGSSPALKRNAEPEVPQDQATRVERSVVLQPGSRSLRIGRGTDAEPTLVPHVLARLVRGLDAGAAAASAQEHWQVSPAQEKDKERELLEVQRGLQRFSGPSRKMSANGGGGGAGGAASLMTDQIEEEVADAPGDDFQFVGLGGRGAKAPAVVCGEEALRVWSQHQVCV